MTETGERQRGDERAKAGAPVRDGIEVWGRRIGRALGWTAAAFLVFQLIRTYGG